MSIRPLYSLIRKDLAVFLTDRRAVILSFAAPLLLAGFFSFAFGVSDGDVGPAARLRDAMFAHVFAGLAVQFLLFSSIESGVGLLLERQKGLWRRLQAAPISKFTLLSARAISSGLIALVMLTVLINAGITFFGIEVKGSIGGLLLISLIYATTTSSLGLLIAALGKTPQAARSLSVLGVLIMVMLGGAWMPASGFPGWLQTVSALIPTRWAIEGFDSALSPTGSFSEVLPHAARLAMFTVAFAALAVWRFRWDESNAA